MQAGGEGCGDDECVRGVGGVGSAGMGQGRWLGVGLGERKWGARKV